MPHPDFEWSQDDAKVEIRIPLSALNHAKPSDIDVQLKGNDVIAVSVGSTELLQRRLHDDVKIDQFIVENGTHLVIECVKNESEMWPALLRLPLPLTDSRFMSAAELDALLRTEMCRLPRDEAIEAELAAKEGAAADVDPDELLDDAFDEITAADTAAATAGTEEAGEEPTEAVSSGQQAAMNHELELTKKEFEDFEKIIASLKAKAESEDESVTEADREKHRESVRLVEQMVHLSKLVRRLRSKRPTIEVLLQVLHLEIWKGRLNHGAASEFEVEQYADDVERETPAHELMKQGLQCLEESDFEGALHKIRLAAIHHNHPVSTCLLQRLYSQMRVLPKAAYFVFRRALLDDMEPSTNLIVGEFIDKGMPLFPPYMALAVYFYQRAASVGSTHAMLTLANTFQHGALHASPAGEELRRGNSDDDRFLAWLQAAEDRGSPRAYFIRCSLHLTGESGQKKSYALAKHYLDRLKRTEPSILSKAPGLEARLTQLKAEEELKANPPAPKAAVAAAPASGAASNASRSNPSSPTDSMGSRTNSMPSGAGQVATRAPANRLEALERASGGAQSNMDPAGRGGAARSGGMLGKRPGNNKWKSFFEKSTKWAIGLYATYCLLFPARLAIMPQTFAVMQWIVDLFGGQPSRPTGRML